MRREQRTGAPGGFTLIELMVSLVLFSVAVAGVLSVAVTMSSAFRDQRAVVATESNARSPMDFLTDVLRNVSPGVQSGAITDYAASGSACTSPRALIVTDGGTGAPDTLEAIYASGAVVTYATASWDGTGALAVDAASAVGIAAGDYVVVTDTNTGIIAKVASVSGANLTMASVSCTTGIPTGGFARGSLVVRAQHAKFAIGTVDGVPNLVVTIDPNASGATAQPVADGVEDLEIAIGQDWNPPDGVIGTEVGTAANDDEWVYNNASDTLQGSAAIRAIRLTLIARAVNGNTGANNATYKRPAAEDHPIASTPDVFRRRVLQSTIEIRNLQGSP